MSQDLFAAFVDTEQNGSQQSGSTTKNVAPISFFDDLKTEVPSASASFFTPAPNPQRTQTVDAGEDDWGDFEAADSGLGPSIQSAPAPVVSSRHLYSLDELGPPKPTPVASDTGSKNKTAALTYSNEWGSSKKDKNRDDYSFSEDSNVLFDANDDFDDDGDFGDFEGTQGDIAPVTQKMPEMDLLGLDDEVIIQPRKPENPMIADISKQPGISFGSTAKAKLTRDAVKPKKEPQTEEAWDDFGSASKAEASTTKPESIANETEEESWDDFNAWDKEVTVPTTIPTKSNSTSTLLPLQGTSDPKAISEDPVPPTNIPPPALLLSIFPSIFQRVETELLKPAASQSQTIRQQIYSDLKTVEYLKGYISILTVFARVVAGRKLRWKRDTILAQSMRIGSASAGRMSGMKVTSIDKTELKKEDGDAAEALHVWTAQSGRVKTAVTEARKTHPELGVVPELREAMPVKTIKEIEGGVPSTRPCALCGLKRDERVSKVDVDVMDSFGEWWIDRTSMHRACRNFWVEHETSLRQR